MHQDYLVYDTEILKAIPYGDLIRDIEYCKGWTDYEGMGISVIGFWLTHKDEPEVSSVMQVFKLVTEGYAHYPVVGFNSANFDDKLMAAHGITIKTTYDVLEQVRIAAGFGAHHTSVRRGYSYKLDAIAQANGMAKTGNGALAPVLWQQGKHQEVKDYCLNDVRITRNILELGLKGELIDPNTGERLKLAALDAA
jgi:hypothetical protein